MSMGGAAADRDLKTAAEAFEAGRYSRAVSMLASSESATSPDSRQYRHNLLISEYLASKSSDPISLMNSLAALDDASPDDVARRSVLRYNRAILFMRCCQFANALAILLPVYITRTDMGLEIGLSIKIALLLLEIFIRTWNISKAEEILEDLIAFRQNLQSANSNGVSCRAIPLTELSLYIHLFQTRRFLFARNEKAAKKTIKLTMQHLNKDPNANIQKDVHDITDYHKASALLVKARLESFGEKYVKSIKLLNNVQFACPKDPRVSIVYLNNLGCVHFAMKRYHAAAFYFQRALLQPGLDHFDVSLSHRIRFSYGLQQLYSERSPNACDDLLANAIPFCGSYWHWMQLGHAAVQFYSEFRNKDFFGSRPSTVFSQVPRFRLFQSEAVPSEIVNNLQRGYSWFQNAILLSPSHEIRQAAILGIAFICLVLSRFSECLHWLDLIESLSIVEQSTSVLMKIYRCEALCSLNRLEEAMKCITQLITMSNEIRNEDDLAAVYNSLCSIYSIYGKYDMALACSMKAHTAQPNDERSLRNIVYLLLRHRSFIEAQFVLFHRLPPPSLTLPQ